MERRAAPTALTRKYGPGCGPGWSGPGCGRRGRRLRRRDGKGQGSCPRADRTPHLCETLSRDPARPSATAPDSTAVRNRPGQHGH
ncbi:hypothetical protein GCM10010269_08130 [Streptomyces humidus]|uniref:Uncharacterized protein n=1 Tax=Streptomyces humidus TaxID=52259 RepID=A0A918FSI9_9ACTN|nr:hypothetical protein GCM10010269_08130 [Streptomyces humidus]